MACVKGIKPSGQKQANEASSKIQGFGRRENYHEGVLACYRELESLSAANLGLSRKKDQTAWEFCKSLFQAVPSIDEEQLKIVANKFEKARYSPHPITVDDFTEAEQAFNLVLKKIMTAGEIKKKGMKKGESKKKKVKKVKKKSE